MSRKYSLWNTILLNFRVLPFRQAIRLPIYVGPNLDCEGLRRGCIRIDAPEIRRKMILLGASRASMFSRREQWTHLRFGSGAVLVLGDGVQVHQGVSIVLPYSGTLVLGAGSLVNQRSFLYATKNITLGRNCRVGWDVQIMDSDAHFVYREKDNSVANFCSPVVFGNNVWIASRCTVRKGARLPPYSILSGSSLLTKDFSDVTTRGNVFAGSPAKLLASGFFRILDGRLENRLKEACVTTDVSSIPMPSDFKVFDHL